MKFLRVLMLATVCSVALTPASAFARGHGGGGRGGGSRGSSWHGGGGGGGYRPFHGGHFGWAPSWGYRGYVGHPGFIWPYGVPWIIYPATVSGYVGVNPDGVPVQPPAPSVVLHEGEVTGMNVGLRFQWQCDNPQALVPTLESDGESNMALVLRGKAAGEANCLVGDGESPPLRVHVVVLPQAPPATATEPPALDPPPLPPQ